MRIRSPITVGPDDTPTSTCRRISKDTFVTKLWDLGRADPSCYQQSSHYHESKSLTPGINKRPNRVRVTILYSLDMREYDWHSVKGLDRNQLSSNVVWEITLD